MHFHRDLLIIADGYAKEVLKVTPEDVFVGSPPLAFTFGLGGLAIFPLRFGATATLLESATPPNMVEIIQTYKATVCFTAPTAYRVMLRAMDEGADLSSLRAAVSAGKPCPRRYEEWMRKTGKPMLDGIGATEMLHIFISNRFGDSHPACTGKPVTGYQARIVDEAMNEVPRGQVGRLAVRGPTGCRYLSDSRQMKYVRDGWNLTGDSFWQDEQGYFHFAARSDDMIISAGYNIAGPEVEAALLAHPHVQECAVIGVPDEERGQIVEAHVVLVAEVEGDAETIKRLQEHVKATIAPFKYPRSIVFTRNCRRPRRARSSGFVFGRAETLSMEIPALRQDARIAWVPMSWRRRKVQRRRDDLAGRRVARVSCIAGVAEVEPSSAGASSDFVSARPLPPASQR